VRHKDDQGFGSEREILYKILFDMKSDMHDLKNLVYEMIGTGGEVSNLTESGVKAVRNLFSDTHVHKDAIEQTRPVTISFGTPREKVGIQDTEELVEESLSLTDREKELIKKALDKNNGKRKLAAAELGISERTLYRKIKEYGLEG
jgi:transcriptional regulator with PAS, ATPase and Fis domain